MSKTEIARQLATASNVKRLDHLAVQIETLRQAKVQSAEELSAILEPLAQAMAALTDETRETLAQIEITSPQQARQFQAKISTAVQQWTQTLSAAEKAAQALSKAANQTQAMLIIIALATGLGSATLTSVFWLWRAPTPTLTYPIDAQEIVNRLELEPDSPAPPAPTRSQKQEKT
ncbi:MAG: IncQ-type mobilization protein MobB [Candidatus Contendobacter sp.]|nr:IncQ-type mobilization protein MobB [Candidatus Contendobacter sp.]